MSVTWLSMVVVSVWGWILPDPSDKLGWGFRVRTQEQFQPFFVTEGIWDNQLIVALINQTKAERKYLLLDVARYAGDLKITILRPDGKPLRASHGNLGPIFFDERWKLPAGQVALGTFRLKECGYHQLPEAGVYELRATLKTTEGVVVAPPFKLTVIAPPTDTIVANQPIPIAGYQSKWPKEKQERAAVQQICVGNRTWLVYRRFHSTELGGSGSHLFRLAELPGKCEMTVDGSFGEGKPVTIIYRSPDAPDGVTRLLIHSVDGSPWVEPPEDTSIPVPRPVVKP